MDQQEAFGGFPPCLMTATASALDESALPPLPQHHSHHLLFPHQVSLPPLSLPLALRQMPLPPHGLDEISRV